MLQNDYLVVKIGVDTAENEPFKFVKIGRAEQAPRRSTVHAAQLAARESLSTGRLRAGTVEIGAATLTEEQGTSRKPALVFRVRS